MTRRPANASQISDLVEWARANVVLASVLSTVELVDVAQRAQYKASVAARTPPSQPRQLGYLPVSMDVLCEEMRRAILDRLTVQAYPQAQRIGTRVGLANGLRGADLDELREDVADAEKISRIIRVFDPNQSDYEPHVGSRLTLRAKSLVGKHLRRRNIWLTAGIAKTVTLESVPDFSIEVEARLLVERAGRLIGKHNVEWLLGYDANPARKAGADRKTAQRLRDQLRKTLSAD
jgi:hypothetical protein